MVDTDGLPLGNAYSLGLNIVHRSHLQWREWHPALGSERYALPVQYQRFHNLMILFSVEPLSGLPQP